VYMHSPPTPAKISEKASVFVPYFAKNLRPETCGSLEEPKLEVLIAAAAHEGMVLPLY